MVDKFLLAVISSMSLVIFFVFLTDDSDLENNGPSKKKKFEENSHCTDLVLSTSRSLAASLYSNDVSVDHPWMSCQPL